jgi:erythromycin esterase-like protein
MQSAARTSFIVLLGLIATPVPAGAQAVSDSAATVAWMRHVAHPFETAEPRDDQKDLAFLERLVGKARIVALGEGTHGTHEFFTMKHRITRYLATRMGFTVFAIEANMPETYKMNDYVLTGHGDPRALLDGMYFWTWNTREVLDLVEWMRAYNVSGRGRMQFTGFDMQTPDTAAAIARRVLTGVDPVAAESLDVCMRLLAEARMRGHRAAFATATGTLPVSALAGHRVRYSGWIRTEHVLGHAGLWMRADGASLRSLAFDNMQSQNVRGTRGWQRYQIELDIPSEAVNINFGMLLSGSGDAWFDSLAIDVDGKPWVPDSSLDLALENRRGPAGFGLYPGEGYTMGLTDDAVRVGTRSLYISTRKEAPPTQERPAQPVELARWLLARVETGRDSMARAITPATADWVIQNVRVVEQCTRMRAEPQGGFTIRDSSMASNVDWILAGEKPGTRIVLWAHNGHVAKSEGRMGSFLARRHGEDMVVMGFAARAGNYTAVRQNRGTVSDNALVVPDIECLESLCHATGLPRFVLDVRRATEDAAAKRWFASPRMMRTIGAMAMEVQFHPADIGKAYDAIVYVDESSATELNRKDR